MALVNVETVLQKTSAMLTGLEPPHGIEILSYKRNRGVALLLVAQDTVLVRERGYREAEWQIDRKELPRLLKTLIKREFPRSRKLRVYQISGPNALDKPRKKL